ncbi:hypothetical protein BN1050_01695 [Metalysinibacillus saudimassiliensis]|uniref:Lipoprotein n=1 Tax=Metalysinibacillus saudimassiliensis TaxID=1461583 RepID=A0A078MC04_9BACL|nr:hypothetical protein BN1050_01695 [Metalysinibacillus saudimassiliensis]
MKKIILGILISSSVLASGCGNELLAVESSNDYRWQRFMNDTEFDKVSNGMSYMDVVRTAGGAGKKQKSGTYLWHDELLITRGYEIQFKEDKVIDKKIVELHGAVTDEDDAE